MPESKYFAELLQYTHSWIQPGYGHGNREWNDIDTSAIYVIEERLLLMKYLKGIVHDSVDIPRTTWVAYKGHRAETAFSKIKENILNKDRSSIVNITVPASIILWGERLAELQENEMSLVGIVSK